MSSQSDIDSMVSKVSRYDDFDFSQTLGSFINNRGFSDGFRKYQAGSNGEQSYVWSILSAIGNQIGSVLNQNIKYYIDNVSNIDTCKVKSLKSMLKQLGFSYQVFEKTDYLPVEIQNLMNIFSIDRNYIIRNKFLNTDLFNVLSSAGAIYSDNYDTIGESLYTIDVFSSSEKVGNSLAGQFSDKNINGFTANTYISCDSSLIGENLFQNAYGTNIVEVSGSYILVKNRAIQTAFPVSAISSVNYFEHRISSIDVQPELLQHLFIDPSIQQRFDDATVFIKRQNYLSACSFRLNSTIYNSYVKQLYYDLLSSFLDMTYADSEHTLVRSTFDNDNYFKSGYFNQMDDEYNNLNSSSDAIQLIKKQYAVSNFDEITIVDNIEEGTDDISNYQGIRRVIIEKEIQNRASTLPFPFLKSSETKSYETPYEKTTRYSFYKKRKVLEYAKFIDDKYFEDLSALSLNSYKFDSSYIEQSLKDKKDDKRRVINGADKNYSINADMIDYVAQALTDTTFYIEKLRQKLKLQSRKNFMKGTQNLIKFIISEYIRDYAYSVQPTKDISSLLESMKLIDSEDVEVQEYVDLTEYYNISTDTSRYAAGYEANNMNSRFFDQYISVNEYGQLELQKPTEYFEFDDILQFYVDNMKLQDTESNRQYVIRLLSSVFDVGASRQYIGEDGITHGMVQDGRYTRKMLVELSTLSAGYADFKEMISLGEGTPSFAFTYPATVWQQEEQAQEYISAVATSTYMSSIYDTYDEYYDSVVSIANAVSDVQADLDTVVSSTYLYYFAKQSACKFCYTDDTALLRENYRHDYFIGNSTYQYSDIDEEITQLNLFIQNSNNIQNYAILDTIDALLNGYGDGTYAGYYGLKDILNTKIINNITAYGYSASGAELLNEEADSIDEFLLGKKTERITYLQNVITDLNSQAKALKLAYENLESQFNSALQNAPDFSDGYMKDLGSSKGPTSYGSSSYYIYYDDYVNGYLAAVVDKSLSDDDKKLLSSRVAPVVGRQKVDRVSGAKLLDTDTGLTNVNAKVLSFNHIPFCQIFQYQSVDQTALISENDTFTEKLTKILTLMSPDNKVFYGENAAGAAGCYSAFASIKAGLTSLMTTWNAMLDVLQNIFGITYTDSSVTNILELQNIVTFQEYLVKNLNETSYANDSKVKEYQKYIDNVISWRNQYNKHVNELNDLTSSTNYLTFVEKLGTAEFTADFFNQLSAYTLQKDEENRDSIISQVQTDNATLASLVEDMQGIASNLRVFVSDGVYQKYALNEDMKIADLLEDVIAVLIEDVNNRIADANNKIQKTIDRLTVIYSGVFNKYVFDETDAKWNSVNYKLSDEVEAKISSVNFFKFAEYPILSGLTLEYSAISSSPYPYYNYKNLTHPSFQTHQFMLNFRPQTVFRETDFTQSYINIFDSTFSFDNIDKCIDMYIGEFGQSINLWLTNSIDYTGYVTTYEKSEHLNDNNVSSWVIDYEGAFFPPAAAEFLSASSSERLGNSVKDAMTRQKISISAVSNINESEVYSKDEIANQTYEYVSNYYEYSEGEFSNVIDSFIRQYYGVEPDQFESYVKKSDLAAHLLSSLDETFYEKYYDHLDLTYYDRAHIADQLSVYREQICDIVSNHEMSAVYDIYKYGKDKYYNDYVLYKRYSQENPTYLQKKDTVGELWIRLKDHPIAFPAISPRPATISCFDYTAIDISSDQYGSEYVDSYIFTKTNNIELSGKCFYDFDFSTEKDILLLVHDPYGSAYSRKIRDYQRANVSLTYVSKLEDTLRMRTIYGFNGQSESTNNSVVKETHNSDLYTNIAKELRESPTRFRLVGLFSSLNDTVKIVAVSFPEEGYSLMSDSTLHVYTADKSNMNFVERAVDLSQPLCDNDLIAFSGYEVSKTAYLDVILYQNSGIDCECSSFNGATVNPGVNSVGEPMQNIYADEVNSHDVFSGNIVIKTYRLFTTGIGSCTTHFFNTNADLAYIPSYPGKNGELFLSSEVEKTGNDYFSIELLGESRNLDTAVLGVNVSANPYMTDDDMYSTETNANGDVVKSNVKLNGRVFEDYCLSDDNSIHIYKNGYMHYMAGSENDLVISIDLSSEAYNYTDDDFWNMNLLVYNTNCSGKNPYFVGRLRDLNKITKNYNSGQITYGNDLQVIATGYTFNFDVTVGGTFQADCPLNYDNNNYIPNILSICLTYDKSIRKLQMNLTVDDKTIDCNIASDTIRFCFYNQYALNQFKHYHLLDAYGIVKTQKTPLDLFADTWSVHYIDPARYNCSYYIDPKTGRQMFLKDINLNDYNYLSDIYIISPNLYSAHKELAFKVGEELAVSSVLDAQYYPTLNTCYPYNSGFYFQENIRSSISSGSAFTESNAYILDPIRSDDILRNIGRIDIPIMLDDTNDIRVFEDYNLNATDIPGHEESGLFNNYDRYCVESEKFNQYVHHFEIPSMAVWTWNYNNMLSLNTDSLEFKQLSALKSETYENTLRHGYITINDISAQGIDLAHLLRVYANYKYDGKNIYLYFNYMNYINTPFIKYDSEGRQIADVIDGTYLKLAPGEDGYLNIVLQFKYYIHRKLYGYVNGTVLTYRIYNLSDDKPKFIIHKVYQISEYETQHAGVFQHLATRTIKVNLPELDVAVDDQLVLGNIDYNVSIESTESLSGTLDFDIEYPAYLLSCVNYAIIDKTIKYDTPGILHLSYAPGEYNKQIIFCLKKRTMSDLELYMNKAYSIKADALTYTDSEMSIDAESGYVRLIPGSSS